MKHTKGKWKARNGLIESENLKRTLASVNSFGIPEIESEANARLIAASPCLLEACFAALLSVDNPQVSTAFVKNVLKTAIKKAVGESTSEHNTRIANTPEFKEWMDK